MKMNYNSTFPYIQNILYTTVTVLLDYYSSTLVLLEDQYTYSYNKYNWFKFGIDRIFRYKRDFINYVYDIKVYPDHDWYNMINIIHLSEKFEYHEHYSKIEKVHNEQSYMKQMRGFYSSLYDNKNKNSVCLMSKFNNMYCVQHTPVYLKNNDIFEKSEISILSVTYSHPSMEEKIDISLPDTILYCHNQLFNFAFVYHCLQYQDKPYVFDEQYRIEIMDSNVDTKIIVYDQYLHVYKEELKVQSLLPLDKEVQ